jgi:hypothetical protein
MEQLKRHIHDELTSEVNEMIIALKLNSGEIYDNATEDQRLKIDKARGSRKMPTTQELIDLLDRVRDEMDKCTMDFKRY